MERQYHKEGYIVIDLDDIDFEAMIHSLKEAPPNTKAQEQGYHYSDSPRMFEAWKWNPHVLKLARHPKVLETLHKLYRRAPKPFQTINFSKGSNQPLHSDTIHFSTIPERWLAAVWVALEDMDEFNGTLQYVPRSHKLPCYNFQDIGLPKAEYGKQFESYALYEEFIKQVVGAQGFEVKQFHCKRGQALVWAASLLHGGAPILDQSRTRWSQATHYYFEGCKYLAPMFSDMHNGEYTYKAPKDILNHVIT